MFSLAIASVHGCWTTTTLNNGAWVLDDDTQQRCMGGTPPWMVHVCVLSSSSAPFICANHVRMCVVAANATATVCVCGIVVVINATAALMWWFVIDAAATDVRMCVSASTLVPICVIVYRRQCRHPRGCMCLHQRHRRSGMRAYRQRHYSLRMCLSSLSTLPLCAMCSCVSSVINCHRFTS